MTTDELRRSGDSLRTAFFDRATEDVAEAIAREEDAARTVLAEATGIEDETLLGRLVGLGIRAETLAALTLAPLVAVAWADGEMDPKERDAILEGAASTGISKGSWSHRLLELWTEERPPADLFLLWRDFVTEFAAQLSDDELIEFRRKVVGRAREVAQAAGGILGIGAVSQTEESMLARVDAAFAKI